MRIGGKIRVILADDKECIRDRLRPLLERHPSIQFLGEARDGQEAIHLVNQVNPEIALLDIEMPCLDGIDAARIIQAKFPEVSILFLSAYADKGFIHVLQEEGFPDYIVKDQAFISLIPAILLIASRRYPVVNYP